MAKENIQYAGFWPRLSAICIDGLIVMFVAWALDSIPINHISVLFFALEYGSFYFFYCVLMLGFWGQTVGMMLSKIKVKKLNLKEIRWKEAFLRYLVNFILAAVYFYFEIYFIKKANESFYVVKNFGHFIADIAMNYKMFNSIMVWNVEFSWMWTLSEVVVLLTNKKKRAIHDFIAGTVVIKIS